MTDAALRSRRPIRPDRHRSAGLLHRPVQSAMYLLHARGGPGLAAARAQLTAVEVIRLVGIAAGGSGVTEVRFTGGEPLVRPGWSGSCAAAAELRAAAPAVASPRTGSGSPELAGPAGRGRARPGQRVARHAGRGTFRDSGPTRPAQRRDQRVARRPRGRAAPVQDQCGAHARCQRRRGGRPAAFALDVRISSCVSSSRCRSTPSTGGTGTTWSPGRRSWPSWRPFGLVAGSGSRGTAPAETWLVPGYRAAAGGTGPGRRDRQCDPAVLRRVRPDPVDRGRPDPELPVRHEESDLRGLLRAGAADEGIAEAWRAGDVRQAGRPRHRRPGLPPDRSGRCPRSEADAEWGGVTVRYLAAARAAAGRGDEEESPRPRRWGRGSSDRPVAARRGPGPGAHGGELPGRRGGLARSAGHPARSPVHRGRSATVRRRLGSAWTPADVLRASPCTQVIDRTGPQPDRDGVVVRVRRIRSRRRGGHPPLPLETPGPRHDPARAAAASWPAWRSDPAGPAGPGHPDRRPHRRRRHGWPGRATSGWRSMFYLLVTLVVLEIPRLVVSLIWRASRRRAAPDVPGRGRPEQRAHGRTRQRADGRTAGEFAAAPDSGPVAAPHDAARGRSRQRTCGRTEQRERPHGTRGRDPPAASDDRWELAGDPQAVGPATTAGRRDAGAGGIDRRLLLARGAAIFAGLTAAGSSPATASGRPWARRSWIGCGSRWRSCRGRWTGPGWRSSPTSTSVR